MKKYKVSNFSTSSSYQSASEDIAEVENKINKMASYGWRLVFTPTESSGYGLLIFEKEELDSPESQKEEQCQ